jgi:hypothetical protein
MLDVSKCELHEYMTARQVPPYGEEPALHTTRAVRPLHGPFRVCQ